MENLNKCWMCGRTKQELDNIANDFGFEDIELNHNASSHLGINVCDICVDIIFTGITNGTAEDIVDEKIKNITSKLIKTIDNLGLKKADMNTKEGMIRG